MALTPDTIPTNEQMVESLSDRFYEPYKKQIWLGTALILGGVVAFLGVREYRRSRAADMWARYHEAAQAFQLTPFGEVDTSGARKQVDTLQILVKDYPNDPVTPFALLQLSKAQTALGDYEGAKRTLEDVRTRFKDFPLNTFSADPDASGRARSLAEKYADSIQRESDWSVQHAYVHKWPSEERLALVETNVGSFWLSFYAEEAPAHVASFIEHAKKGDYNGTQVYRVIQSVEGAPERFEAGSKASDLDSPAYERDPAEHDRDEPTDTIEPEDTRSTMRHVFRIVCAAKMESGESATRFVVITKRDGLRKFDGDYTPFAAVVDREKSLEVIDQIGRATTYRTNAETKDADGAYRMGDHPYPFIYIRRVTIWSKEKIEDGHTWDTKNAQEAKGATEPWEANIPAAPKPQEFEKAKPTPAKDDPANPESPKKDEPPK
jgi:cyclophilin family peptidyl-prolyl cis-trans isomerase